MLAVKGVGVDAVDDFAPVAGPVAVNPLEVHRSGVVKLTLALAVVVEREVNIHRIAEDGTVTDENGTYTIDENDKTIDIDVDVICANTWIGTKSGKLKILALDNDGLRIALPNGDGYAYSLNYYSERKREFDDATPC